MIVILLGLALAIACVILLVVEPSDGVCVARPWVLSLSFTMTVGTMMTKNYRIHKIFNNNLRARVVKENLVWGYTIMLCLVDIIVLVLWMVSAPPSAAIIPSKLDEKLAYKYCISKAGENDSGEIIQNDSILWLIVVLKVGIVGFTSYLGWKIRHLPSLFSEAKYIAMCSYNLALIGLLIIGLGVALDDAPEAVFLLRSVGILVVIIVVLSLLFVAKFWSIKTKPNLTMEQALKEMNSPKVVTVAGKGNQPTDSSVETSESYAQLQRVRERLAKTRKALEEANKQLLSLGKPAVEVSEPKKGNSETSGVMEVWD